MKAKPISQLLWVKSNIRPIDLPNPALRRMAPPPRLLTIRESRMAAIGELNCYAGAFLNDAPI